MAGLTEAKADLVADGYAACVSPAESAALQLTDALIGDPHRMSDETRAALQAAFKPEEIVELALGVGLFMGMSKVLITLGLEPEQMDVTVLPTPGSR